MTTTKVSAESERLVDAFSYAVDDYACAIADDSETLLAAGRIHDEARAALIAHIAKLERRAERAERRAKAGAA